MSRTTLLALLLGAATIVAYIPALQAGFIWDDDDYLTANPHLTSVAGLGRVWAPGETPQYYPLVFTSFWIERHLWGLRPFGFHAVNVLLHVLNAFLVWRLAVRLNLAGAWMIAAVFALHPVHVESVAWITERKNVLSGALYLLAALAYLRFDGSRRGGWYAAALALFVGALLSKTVTASLPVALVIMMALDRERPITMRRLLPLAPLVVLGVILGLHTAHLERVHVEASGAAFDLAFSDRLAVAGRALLFYPAKLLVPTSLCFIYPRWAIDTGQLTAFWPLPVIAAIGAVAVIAFARGRRGPALALLFYLVTIFPALGFVNVYPMLFSFVADHFQYLASLGVIALVVGIAMRVPVRKRLRPLLATAVLLTLGAVTWLQGRWYQDYENGRLWAWTLRLNPECWLAHANLGTNLCRRGLLDEGEPHLVAAVALQPGSPLAQSNLGHLRLLQGREAEAQRAYEQAVIHDPRYAVEIAQVLIGAGFEDAAEPWMRRGLETNPEYEDGRRWLEDRLRRRRELDAAPPDPPG